MPQTLKHRWSLGHNYLAGITAGDWWRLLRENKFAVDPVYWHRAAFVSAVSLLNSFYRRKEERLYHDAIAQTQITRPPLFLLGHWRSGTTHLHNLLAQDTEQFTYANTYQVINPHTFLGTEDINTRRFAKLIPNKRPMDNMALSFQTPQEDEFAPCLISRRSLYLGISFPRREDDYGRYLTFRDVPRAEVEQWKAGFTWFLKKLTLKYPGRTIVLKSPPHTARVKMLLEMFPGARFIHIHREPYTVFQSCQHFYDTAMWYTYMQRPELEKTNERILRRYTAVYEAFFEERALIPPARFHEISFEDLERDPVRQVQAIYEKLNLSGFQKLQPKLQRYVGSLKDYQKNEFAPLSPELRDKVGKAWRITFEEWGYPL